MKLSETIERLSRLYTQHGECEVFCELQNAPVPVCEIEYSPTAGNFSCIDPVALPGVRIGG